MIIIFYAFLVGQHYDYIHYHIYNLCASTNLENFCHRSTQTKIQRETCNEQAPHPVSKAVNYSIEQNGII